MKRLAKIRWYLKEINLNFWRENREVNLDWMKLVKTKMRTCGLYIDVCTPRFCFYFAARNVSAPFCHLIS